MAANEDNSTVNANPISEPLHQSMPFLEVLCKISGKPRRFATGTTAGFALTFMNKKLLQVQRGTTGDGSFSVPLASHIEAVKDGEEPIVFGPTATLVNFGRGWKLQTATETAAAAAEEAEPGGGRKRVGLNGVPRRVHKVKFEGLDDFNLMKNTSKSEISFQYIGKILLSFLIIFVFGAICTLFLENLPQLIAYIREQA